MSGASVPEPEVPITITSTSTLGDAQPPILNTQSPSPNYKWAVVGMLWFICFFNYADRIAISSVNPILRRDFHFTNEQIGIIGSAFSWIYAAAAPFAGWVGDQLSRKRVIIFGLYVWSLVTGFTGLCTRFWQFVTVRATEGLGETFYIPASMSLVSDYHGKETRSRAIGVHQTSIYGGTIFGAWFAGWMAAEHGWQSPFILLGGAGIILGLVLAKFVREPVRGEADPEFVMTAVDPGVEEVETSPAKIAFFGIGFGLIYGILAWQALRAFLPEAQSQLIGIGLGVALGAIYRNGIWALFGLICKKPIALLLLLGFTGTNAVAVVFLVWAPTYLHDVFKVPIAQAGLMAQAPIQIGTMGGAMLGGLMADRLRRRMKGGRMFVQGIGTLLGIPFLAALGFSPQLTPALVALACFGIAKGIHDANISAGFFDVVPLKSRAAAVGMLNLVGWSAGAVWAVGFGRLVAQKVPMGPLIGYNAGIYAFVCCVFLYAALVRAPRDVAA